MNLRCDRSSSRPCDNEPPAATEMERTRPASRFVLRFRLAAESYLALGDSVGGERVLPGKHKVAYTKLGQPELISGGVVVGDAAASSQTARQVVAELLGISTRAVNPGSAMIGRLLAGAR